MDTCIRFVCFIENCSVRENGCKCVFSQIFIKVYGLFALHVNVGRFYFVFFLAFCNILYTFVGINRIKLKKYLKRVMISHARLYI